MADLLSSLTAASRALQAQQFGLDVTGQNIANINTPGYVRRTLQLAAVPPVGANSAGGGVDAVRVQAARAPLIETRLRLEQPAAGREAAVAESLSVVQSMLGTAGASVDSALTNLYDAFNQLSQDPGSAVARQQVIAQAGALGTNFDDIATRLASATTGADNAIRAGVTQVNDLAARVAALNKAIGSSGPEGSDTLRDEQGSALRELAGLIDYSSIENANGTVDVTVGNGRALVVGMHSYQMAATSTGPSGLAQITMGGANVTAEITSGRVGGLLKVRDVLVPDYMNRLDQLAFDVVGSVNAVHQAGYDQNGNPGGTLFNAIGTVAGAASLVAVRPAVAADGKLIAASGTATSPGDNQNARDLAALRTTPLGASSAIPTDVWGSLVYRVATDTQAAQRDQLSHDEVVSQLMTLRDQVSGVSLDEEATMMMKFQRGYEANARFFNAVNQTLDTLLNLVR